MNETGELSALNYSILDWSLNVMIIQSQILVLFANLKSQTY